MEFTETERIRQEPDVYSGPAFDQHRPRWITSFPKEGDEEVEGDVTFAAKDFPPGTRIIIQEPLCPKCRETYENCMVRNGSDSCDFDWKQWVDEMYS